MTQLFLLLNLIHAAAFKGVAVMPSQPCVWPNPCAKPVETTVLAQFQPCVWPNRCSGKNAETTQI